MRTLLISANTEMLPDPVFPLGLACISSALDLSRHEHEVLDLCFIDDYQTAIAGAVSSFKPDALALSLRNVDNVAYPNVHSYLPYYREVVSFLRRLTSAPLILGGSGFSLMPQPILSYLQADYGICGEGERSFIRLLDQLEAGCRCDALPGVASLRSPHPQPASIDWIPGHELTAPCREKFDGGKYLSLGGMGNLQTKRGCGFSCIYCTYPLIEGHQVRTRSASSIILEIEHLCRQGINTFFIVDDVFNFPLHHAKSICTSIIKSGLEVQWSCYLNPQFVTESLLRVMKEAGCSGVEFGVDSGCDAQLKRLGKSFTKADVLRASNLCHKAGMPFCHSLVFGGPGENRKTIQETFDLMAETSPTAVIAMTGIRVFPGTALAASATARDLLMEGESMLEPVFFIAEACRAYLLEVLYSHAEKNHNWILPGSNVNINRRLQSKLRSFGVKGPLWEYMQTRRG